MEIVNKNNVKNKVLEPMIDVLDKKNIFNCMYYSDANSDYELVIDTSRLSFVNRNILYTMANVFVDCFGFGDNLTDDLSSFITYGDYDKKKSFEKHRYSVFHMPNLGEEFNDYAIGFFLEFANCFVEQEPIPEMMNIYTAEEIKRIEHYHRNGCEDQKDIIIIAALGKTHPSRFNPNVVHSSLTYFSNGKIVKNHGFKMTGIINKNFSLETTRAINNYNRYKIQKANGDKAKIKAKTVYNG